ncbi:hypothetical protein DNK56_06155 [Streptomyces sp. AC1-42W]|nr:hypothetical protein DNK55_25410 [Streptomyces sp. AC1-42T]PZT81723.1 hypothetical protein DNK56_06155 [Streptomyces sp. AC1-42W]
MYSSFVYGPISMMSSRREMTSVQDHRSESVGTGPAQTRGLQHAVLPGQAVVVGVEGAGVVPVAEDDVRGIQLPGDQVAAEMSSVIPGARRTESCGARRERCDG